MLVTALGVATIIFTGAATAQSLVDIEGDEPNIELTDNGGSGSGGVEVITDQGTVGGNGVVQGNTEDGLSIDLGGEGNQGDREGTVDVGVEASPDGDVSASANPLLVTEQASIGDSLRDEVQLKASPDDGISGHSFGAVQNEQVQGSVSLDQFSANPDEGVRVLGGTLVFNDQTGPVGTLFLCDISPDSVDAPQEACEGEPINPADPQGSLENLQDRLEEQLPLPEDQLDQAQSL